MIPPLQRGGTIAPPRTLEDLLQPLRREQVWRFSLYYFFVFGSFVALALWLPRYMIGVYGLDLKTAGVLATTFSLSASLFRAYGGVLADRYGARRIMYASFGVSLLVLFMLSYPATDYTIHGIKGPITFPPRWDWRLSSSRYSCSASSWRWAWRRCLSIFRSITPIMSARWADWWAWSAALAGSSCRSCSARSAT
jgi:nitrate/nitrite transporter NarK